MKYRSFFKYLTVSERDRSWQIYCTDTGYTEIPPGVHYPPRAKEHPPQYSSHWDAGRVLSEFQLIYITRGRGALKTNGKKQYPIHEGTLFMLFPGCWHWYSPDGKVGWDEYWVGFNGPYPQALQEKGFFSPRDPVFYLGLDDFILHHFVDMFDIVNGEAPGYQQRLGAIVIEILAKMTSFSLRQRQDSQSAQIVQKAKFLFEESIYEDLDMVSAARSLGVSYPCFRQLFKDYTGLSPYQHFLQLKINKAKIMLEEGRYSVKEISYRLGFDNQYYFSRLFKKKAGVSPSLWRSAE